MVDYSHIPELQEMVSLAAVDLQSDENIIIQQMMEQFSTVGFAYVKNVPGWDELEHFNLVKALHDLPESEKHKLKMAHHNPQNKSKNRGLIPFIDNDVSHKEIFDMGYPYSMTSEDQKKFILVNETPFPEAPEYVWIREGYEKYFYLFNRLGIQLVNYIAQGLGKPANFFDSWFERDPLSTFRSIFYLPRNHENAAKCDQLPPDLIKLTTPEHCDTGFMTILTTFGYPGLQIFIDGEFKSIKPEPNCFVVNLGETFQRITNNSMKATCHRVLDIGCPRYSSPFFLTPKWEAMIPTNILDPPEEQSELPVMFGPWLTRRMVSKYVEWQGFDLSELED